MNSPPLPDPSGSVWSRFVLDPRSSGDFRAADKDREAAREVITEAYAQGQLTHEEYTHRLGDVLQANHLGQLVPLLSDLQVQPTGSAVDGLQSPAGPPAPRPPGTVAGLALPPSGTVRTALFVVGVTNLVWVWTCIGSSSLLYYWPMWPALGMAIMVLSTMSFGDPAKRRDREIRRREGRSGRELE